MDALDPFKDFTPRQNAPRETAPTAAKAFVADMTDDELRKLAREKLSEALQAVNASLQPDLARRLAETQLDRLDGKPGQAVTLDATIRSITVNAMISFVEPTCGTVIEYEPRTISGSIDK